MLDKVLRRSDALDKESLCIIAGQRVRHFIAPYVRVDTVLGLASEIDSAFSVVPGKNGY
jgi:exosome complex RNA-binding protein Rrp42 (RNase PH superfamily)